MGCALGYGGEKRERWKKTRQPVLWRDWATYWPQSNAFYKMGYPYGRPSSRRSMIRRYTFALGKKACKADCGDCTNERCHAPQGLTIHDPSPSKWWALGPPCPGIPRRLVLGLAPATPALPSQPHSDQGSLLSQTQNQGPTPSVHLRLEFAVLRLARIQPASVSIERRGRTNSP